MKKEDIKIPIWKLLSRQIKFQDEKQRIYRSENNKAVKEAKRMMNDRLEKMNHLQAKMDKQTEVSISRIEFEAYKREVATEIKGMARYINIGIGIWLLLTIIIGAILTLIFNT